MTIGDGGAAWKRTGWYITPKRTTEVMQLLGRIGVYSSGQQFAWRGMSSVDFNMISSLQRRLGNHATEEEVRAAEIDILTRARAWGLGVNESGHVDDLQLLADLQHYGVPTRLLDFTSNPMTALWFACQEAPERDRDTDQRLAKSGLVLALNITKWRRHTTVGDPYGMTWGQLEDGNGWTLKAALDNPEPFVVEQTVPNARLRVQEGFFIASSVPARSGFQRILKEPFVSLDLGFAKGEPEELEARLTSDRRRGNPRPLPFVAIIIGAGLKNKLRTYLENSYNRRARALFPDYQGFGQYGLPPLERVQRHPRPASERATAAEQPEAGT